MVKEAAVPGGLFARLGVPGALLEGMRPKQWVKNVLVFAGLLFTLDEKERNWTHDLTQLLFAFIIFCLLSGCVYLINDTADVEADRRHPKKSRRPIASGRLPIPVAIGFTVVCVPAALVAGYLYVNPGDPRFAISALLYFTLTLAYTFRLKHVVIVDVMALAGGFILRAIAGTLVIHVQSTRWLLICTGLLALFIGLAKRRSEYVATSGGTETRQILQQYSLPLLDQMMTIVATSCLISYILYTFTSATGQKHPYLMATAPFVLYGLFRYQYLLLQEGKGEAPEEVLLKDRPMLLNVVLWIIAVIVIITVKF